MRSLIYIYTQYACIHENPSEIVEDCVDKRTLCILKISQWTYFRYICLLFWGWGEWGSGGLFLCSVQSWNLFSCRAEQLKIGIPKMSTNSRITSSILHHAWSWNVAQFRNFTVLVVSCTCSWYTQSSSCSVKDWALSVSHSHRALQVLQHRQ